MHVRGTFLDISLSKRSHLKGKNLSYLTNDILNSKPHFWGSKGGTEKSLTSYLWSEVDV